MTQFDELFAYAAGTALDVFGEPLVYVPRIGEQRTIQHAVVTRSFPQPLDGAPQQHTPQIVIKVAADRREGIDVTEINVGGDSVLVGERVGGPPVVKFISKVNPARRGFTEFEVR